MHRWVLAGLALAAVGSLTAWCFWPKTDEVTILTAQQEAKERPRRPGRAEGERPERPRVERKHAKRKPSSAEKGIAPEEKVKVRSAFREERMLALDEQLDAYAEEAGWDAEKTETVRSILVETIDHIGTELAMVDAGEEDWEVLRPELRQYRIDRAAEIEGILGKEFDSFAEAMAFGRFLGERPPGKERFEPFIDP